MRTGKMPDPVTIAAWIWVGGQVFVLGFLLLTLIVFSPLILEAIKDFLKS